MWASHGTEGKSTSYLCHWGHTHTLMHALAYISTSHTKLNYMCPSRRQLLLGLKKHCTAEIFKSIQKTESYEMRFTKSLTNEVHVHFNSQGFSKSHPKRLKTESFEMRFTKSLTIELYVDFNSQKFSKSHPKRFSFCSLVCTTFSPL